MLGTVLTTDGPLAAFCCMALFSFLVPGTLVSLSPTPRQVRFNVPDELMRGRFSDRLLTLAFYTWEIIIQLHLYSSCSYTYSPVDQSEALAPVYIGTLTL